MPQPPILRVTEIFPSFQGEGLRQGEATIFIRLSGCNLRCSFCDTKYAWKEGRSYSSDQILNVAKRIQDGFPTEWVCITDGEPLCQDIFGLARRLKKEHFHIQVETNATLFAPLPVDWFTISPKPEEYFFRREYREKAKEVKIIVTKNLDLAVIRKLRKAFLPKTPLLLQPQSNRKWSMDLAIKLLTRALTERLENVRLSLQLHKIYKLR